MPRVVWAGESKTALEFEIGPRQQKIWWHLNLQLMGLCYKEGHGLVDNVAWRWRFCRRDICDICRTTPIWRKMTSFNDVTWRLSTCCFQRRSERLGVTKRHELLSLALLLHVQSPGTYFMSSYTYRKLNNFRLRRYDANTIRYTIHTVPHLSSEGEKTRINTINYRWCWSSINTQSNMRPFAAD